MRFVTTLVCAGLVLMVSPVKAQDPPPWPTNWNKVDVFAARWMKEDGTVRAVGILKNEASHDTAIVKNGLSLTWELKCAQFNFDGSIVSCAAELEFAIVDFHFVADLDSIADNIAPVVANSVEDADFGDKVKLKRGRKRVTEFSENFRQDFDPENRGKGRGHKTDLAVQSGVVGDEFKGKSQLWKYTIVVEDPSHTQSCGFSNPDPTDQGCLHIDDEDNATLNAALCAESPLCDIWDPHVYTHGDRDY